MSSGPSTPDPSDHKKQDNPTDEQSPEAKNPDAKGESGKDQNADKPTPKRRRSKSGGSKNTSGAGGQSRQKKTSAAPAEDESSDGPKREMIINYTAGEECRIAIALDGTLDELYQERASTEFHVGNIYKGKVTNVEPSIQAAFVDFGLERNGFLHVSDLHPRYFPKGEREEFERVGMKTPRRDRPPIQKCLRRGDDIIVQVLKEGLGTKGPTLTSYLSIPGRYIVMMPYMEKLGVTRKIEDDDARREMRKLLDELDPPKGFGFIVRTAGMGQTKTELKRDLAYLQRLWNSIERRLTKGRRVGELYAEGDLVIRTIRDVFSPQIERIVIDDRVAAHRARDFLSIASPRAASRVYLYKDAAPIFERYGIEEQIDHINDRHVPMPSGGSLVIEQTEALVAIDVNSGKMRDNKDAETTAYKTNLEAADEICRQLRLRDLGGVIVNDFIDMREEKHRRGVERALREAVKRDRARTKVLRISPFGLIEMTRQRIRPSLRRSIYEDCPCCDGVGQVKTSESMAIEVMRTLMTSASTESVRRVDIGVQQGVANYLINKKRREITNLEEAYAVTVNIQANSDATPGHLTVRCFDEIGNEIHILKPEPSHSRR